MVDITASIDNAVGLVAGLNELIRRNKDSLAGIGDALEFVTKPELREGLRKLRTSHEHHIDLLGGTVLLLGGAPAAEQDWHHWISEGKVYLGKLRGDKGVLQAVHSEEEDLRDEYFKKIGELKNSPEAVSMIREILDDSEKNLEWLERAIMREG